MAKKIEDAVVVIVGASSGIGRATALEFARRGANVVVAARRERLLREVAEQCRQLSGREAVAIPADVTDEAAVQALAQQIFEHFGRLDVWANIAGVGAFGTFDKTPTEVFRRVVEVNFFGEVHGARAALPFFRSQGSGVLINMASMLSEMGAPYYSAYAASKFAIRGFSESLREELRALDRTDIHVCTIMPATIDTPFFEHAANYTGRAINAMPPVYDVEMTAKTIVSCAEKPQREVFVGNAARMLNSIHSLAPAIAEPMIARQVDLTDFKNGEPAANTNGNLFEPMQSGGGTSGGWNGKERTNMRRLATAGAAAVGTAVAAGVWLWQRQKD